MGGLIGIGIMTEEEARIAIEAIQKHKAEQARREAVAEAREMLAELKEFCRENGLRMRAWRYEGKYHPTNENLLDDIAID